MNGLFASFEEGKSPEIIAVTLHFVKKKKKVDTQEQLSGNKAFHKLKAIIIENTTTVISYQDTKVFRPK